MGVLAGIFALVTRSTGSTRHPGRVGSHRRRRPRRPGRRDRSGAVADGPACGCHPDFHELGVHAPE